MAMNCNGRGKGRTAASSVRQVYLQRYMVNIDIRFGVIEEQLRVITEQLANQGARRASTNPSEDDDSGGSDVNPFQSANRQDDHRRHRRL